jgi:hypothetical protein
MARVYVPESSKPKKDETAEEAAPVTGRVYLPASRSPKAAAKEAKAAARAEAKARAEAEAAAEDAKAKAAAGEPEPTPTPTPSTLSDESGAAPPAKPEDEPAANADHRGLGRVRPDPEGRVSGRPPTWLDDRRASRSAATRSARSTARRPE